MPASPLLGTLVSPPLPPLSGAAFVYFGMVPVDARTPVARRLIEYTRSVLDALWIQWGATHGEVILTEDGPCLVEMNCRSHGADGSWVPLAKALTGGYCQVDALLDAYVEPERFMALPPLPPPFRAAGLEVLLVSTREGDLVAIPGFDRARQLESFASIEPFVKPGERLEKTVDVFTQVASVVLVHTDASVVARDVESLRALESSGEMFVLRDDAHREEELASDEGVEIATAAVTATISLGTPASFLSTPPLERERRDRERRELARQRRQSRPVGSVMAFSSPFLSSAARRAASAAAA